MSRTVYVEGAEWEVTRERKTVPIPTYRGTLTLFSAFILQITRSGSLLDTQPYETSQCNSLRRRSYYAEDCLRWDTS